MARTGDAFPTTAFPFAQYRLLYLFACFFDLVYSRLKPIRPVTTFIAIFYSLPKMQLSALARLLPILAAMGASAGPIKREVPQVRSGMGSVTEHQHRDKGTLSRTRSYVGPRVAGHRQSSRAGGSVRWAPTCCDTSTHRRLILKACSACWATPRHPKVLVSLLTRTACSKQWRIVSRRA